MTEIRTCAKTKTKTKTIDYTAFDYTAFDYTAFDGRSYGSGYGSGYGSSDGSGIGSSDSDDTFSDGDSSDLRQLVPIPPRMYNFSPLLDCMIRRRMGSGVCNSSHIAVLTSSFEKSQWYLLHVKGKNRGGGKL
jgi:hypothetical protein